MGFLFLVGNKSSSVSNFIKFLLGLSLKVLLSSLNASSNIEVCFFSCMSLCLLFVFCVTLLLRILELGFHDWNWFEDLGYSQKFQNSTAIRKYHKEEQVMNYIYE
jgi:hypothetical protein